MTKPTAVLIRFANFEDPLTMERRLEAKAIDPETHHPVASLSLEMMRAWLRRNGYRWRTGSSGIWERAA